MIETLEAHHRPDHDKGPGHKNNVPEIDGGELPIALLLLFCIVMLLKKIRK